MAASALEEERLRRFLRRRRRGQLVEPPSLGVFLAETLDLAARLVPSEGGSLLLDDPAHRRGQSCLTFVAAFGSAAPRLVGQEVPQGRGIVGHVYATGQAYAMAGVDGDPRFFPGVDAVAGFRSRSVIATPVRLEQSVCGVFELVNRRGRAEFSVRDRELMELLAQYISRAILNAVDILKQNELALRDDLTDLGNVRALEPYLGRALRGRRAKVGLLFIDVDGLKAINDRFGHRVGSALLRATGAVIGKTVGASGGSFRFGGDEFVVICPSADADIAHDLARRICAGVANLSGRPIAGGGKLPNVSASIGVASADLLAPEVRPRVGRSARLLSAADRAMYRAKRKGCGRTERATVRDDILGRS